MAWATSSSSRKAFQARPMREFRRRKRDENDQQTAGQNEVVDLLGGDKFDRADRCPCDSYDPLCSTQPGAQEVRKDENPDDLAKAQCRDREIIAPHLQDRDAQEDPAMIPDSDGKRKGFPEGEM